MWCDRVPPKCLFSYRASRPLVQNCFLDFAVEHWFGCRATEPHFAGDIGAKWLIDWLVLFDLEASLDEVLPDLLRHFRAPLMALDASASKRLTYLQTFLVMPPDEVLLDHRRPTYAHRPPNLLPDAQPSNVSGLALINSGLYVPILRFTVAINTF